MNRWRSHSKMEWLAQTGREIALLTFAALGYFWKWICSNKETSLWTGWPGGAIEMVPPTLSPAQGEQENTVCHPFSMPATTSVNNEQTLKTALPRAVFATKASQRQKATRIDHPESPDSNLIVAQGDSRQTFDRQSPYCVPPPPSQ